MVKIFVNLQLLLPIEKKGIKGLNEIKNIMKGYREKPISKLDGNELVYIEDYEKSEKYNLQTGLKSILKFPKSNVLIFESNDGTRVAIRPSGTEPKIKFYFSVNDTLDENEDWETMELQLDQKIGNIVNGIGL